MGSVRWWWWWWWAHLVHLLGHEVGVQLVGDCLGLLGGGCLAQVEAGCRTDTRKDIKQGPAMAGWRPPLDQIRLWVLNKLVVTWMACCVAGLARFEWGVSLCLAGRGHFTCQLVLWPPLEVLGCLLADGDKLHIYLHLQELLHAGLRLRGALIVMV